MGASESASRNVDNAMPYSFDGNDTDNSIHRSTMQLVMSPQGEFEIKRRKGVSLRDELMDSKQNYTLETGHTNAVPEQTWMNSEENYTFEEDNTPQTWMNSEENYTFQEGSTLQTWMNSENYTFGEGNTPQTWMNSEENYTFGEGNTPEKLSPSKQQESLNQTPDSDSKLQRWLSKVQHWFESSLQQQSQCSGTFFVKVRSMNIALAIVTIITIVAVMEAGYCHGVLLWRTLLLLSCFYLLYKWLFVNICPYQQICERFFNTLSLPEAFLEPQYNQCFCMGCHKSRKDKEVYKRGIPPKNYGLPIGWTRFSLRASPSAKANDAFNKWHIAFHGTASKNVRKILDVGHLVLPGSLIAGGTEVNQPQGHFTKDDRPRGFDVDQIFVSPSIKYSGCEVYARATDFTDPVTKKNYKCRVVFQVYIKPGSYSVGRETIGYGQRVIDSKFDNSEIEWSTKQYGTTFLYGLLIKAEEQKI